MFKTTNIHKITDDYLLSLTKSISPFMNVCSFEHTSFSTASINQKNQQIQISLPKNIDKEDITQYANDKLFPK